MLVFAEEYVVVLIGMETYLCDVTSNAGARAVGEGDEGASLSRIIIVLADGSLSHSDGTILIKTKTYLSVTVSQRSGRNSSASLPQISLLWCMVYAGTLSTVPCGKW